ncbi:histone deacetylase [bacterium]|nr:histone deacetylase [bacterium]
MGDYHVESPQRLEAVYQMIEDEIKFPYLFIKPRAAKEEEIGLIHTPSYVQKIKETSSRERVVLDPDTSTSAQSYRVALLAAGGILETVDKIMEGKIQNAFALIRPPGHHAEASRAMGFCLFNNVAIGAQYLLERYNQKRILIVDWDLHHGNGTQHSFEQSPNVLYFSTHQHPHYPGTGDSSEIGQNSGEGFTVNVPLSPGKTDEDYLYIYRNILSPISEQYQPDFILVSAGFDTFEQDPLGGMKVTSRGFGALTQELMDLSQKICGGKILAVLEGGYHLRGLREGVKEVLTHLGAQGPRTETSIQSSPQREKELSPFMETYRKYWNL